MDMVARQYAFDDPDFELCAYLTRNITDAQPHGGCQNLVTIFGNPDDVVAIVKFGVGAGRVAHFILQKKGYAPGGSTFFLEYKMVTKTKD